MSLVQELSGGSTLFEVPFEPLPTLSDVSLSVVAALLVA
jgi:hypothetical protein